MIIDYYLGQRYICLKSFEIIVRFDHTIMMSSCTHKRRRYFKLKMNRWWWR